MIKQSIFFFISYTKNTRNLEGQEIILSISNEKCSALIIALRVPIIVDFSTADRFLIETILL